jgi:hypothetical protein
MKDLVSEMTRSVDELLEECLADGMDEGGCWDTVDFINAIGVPRGFEQRSEADRVRVRWSLNRLRLAKKRLNNQPREEFPLSPLLSDDKKKKERYLKDIWKNMRTYLGTRTYLEQHKSNEIGALHSAIDALYFLAKDGNIHAQGALERMATDLTGACE